LENAMSDVLDKRGVQPPPDARGRRYRRHELGLADGDRLVLGTDGRIERLDGDGTTIQAWLPGDPGWPDQAIRFGLRPQAETVKPRGGRDTGTDQPLG
jgi:hypothetical protein